MKKRTTKKPAKAPSNTNGGDTASDYIRTTISLHFAVLEKGKTLAGRYRLSFSDLLARLIDEKSRDPSATITIVPLEEPVAPRATR